MKLLQLLILTCGVSTVACNSTGDEVNYSVEDSATVSMAVSGMT